VLCDFCLVKSVTVGMCELKIRARNPKDIKWDRPEIKDSNERRRIGCLATSWTPNSKFVAFHGDLNRDKFQDLSVHD
jgi:hypothetical protein